MSMMFNETIELFLPTPAHLVLGLCGLAVWSFKRNAPLYRWRKALAGLAVWAWVLSAPLVADRMLVWLEGEPEQAKTIRVARDANSWVIVLASGEMQTPSGVNRVRLDAKGWERLHAGVQLWRQSGGTMVFTAGPPGNPAASMARYMASVARDMGVPEQAMAINPQALSTYRELQAARDIVAQKPGPVWLVTSAMHMPRALQVARKLGLEAQPYPVGFRQIIKYGWWSWTPNNGTLERMLAALHEIIGMVVYRVRGMAE
jgi:uncharacterized SAM-binding protein YcdF (DUF218 family)